MSTQLKRELENDIIFGVYPPRTRITEDSIMTNYNAKRHAVRNAFAILESEGLLIRKPNRGVEVVEYTPDEVDALYDLRIILESAAAQKTALPVDIKIIEQMEDIAAQHASGVESKDFRKVFELNQRFHELQYSCCNNPLLINLIAKHARMAQPIRVVKYDDQSHMAAIVEQHMTIIDALKGSSHDAYVKSVCEHLPASAEAYRILYERRFGARKTSR